MTPLSLTMYDVEEIVLTLGDIVKENRRLREENAHLREKIEEDNKFINEMHDLTMGNVGAFMNAIANGCICPPRN